MELDLTKLSTLIDFIDHVEKNFTQELKSKYSESTFDQMVSDGYLIKPSYDEFIEEKFQEELGQFTHWLTEEYHNRY